MTGKPRAYILPDGFFKQACYFDILRVEREQVNPYE